MISRGAGYAGPGVTRDSVMDSICRGWPRQQRGDNGDADERHDQTLDRQGLRLYRGERRQRILLSPVRLRRHALRRAPRGPVRDVRAWTGPEGTPGRERPRRLT